MRYSSIWLGQQQHFLACIIIHVVRVCARCRNAKKKLTISWIVDSRAQFNNKYFLNCWGQFIIIGMIKRNMSVNTFALELISVSRLSLLLSKCPKILLIFRCRPEMLLISTLLLQKSAGKLQNKKKSQYFATQPNQKQTANHPIFGENHTQKHLTLSLFFFLFIYFSSWQLNKCRKNQFAAICSTETDPIYKPYIIDKLIWTPSFVIASLAYITKQAKKANASCNKPLLCCGRMAVYVFFPSVTTKHHKLKNKRKKYRMVIKFTILISTQCGLFSVLPMNMWSYSALHTIILLSRRVR